MTTTHAPELLTRGELQSIAAHDPDGGSVEPTDAARAAFRSWFIQTHGVAEWVRYSQTSWDEVSR